MQQKNKQLRGSGAQTNDRRGLSLGDKYLCLRQENQKLKQRFRTVCDALSYWKWSALEAQAERDCLREELQDMALARREA